MSHRKRMLFTAEAIRHLLQTIKNNHQTLTDIADCLTLHADNNLCHDYPAFKRLQAAVGERGCDFSFMSCLAFLTADARHNHDYNLHSDAMFNYWLLCNAAYTVTQISTNNPIIRDMVCLIAGN